MIAAGPSRREAGYFVDVGDVERDRDAVLSVWRGHLGKEASLPAKFDWFYRQNPYGPPLLMLLRHGPSGTVVGVGAAGPRRMRLGERTILAGVLVDLAVVPHHRSLGPALTLQKALAIEAKGRFDLLYGFPNSKALPVFLRAGFTILGKLERHSCVLRHSEYLTREMPRGLALPLGAVLDARAAAKRAIDAWGSSRPRFSFRERSDPRMDALWANADKSDALLAIRDTSFLRWRFEDVPNAPCHYLLVEGSARDELRAWFACAREGNHLHVLDFWSADGASGASSADVGALLRAAFAEGYASVTVEYAGPSSRFSSFAKAGFVFRESRPIVGIWTRDPLAPPEKLHFTAADEDE